MLEFYANFEINDETGDPLTDHDMTQLHYSRITSLQVCKIVLYLSHMPNSQFNVLQKAAFAKFPDLRDFALANVANVDTRDALLRHFKPLEYVLFFELVKNVFLTFLIC
jgi:intron-binding protein aquarius